METLTAMLLSRGYTRTDNSELFKNGDTNVYVRVCMIDKLNVALFQTYFKQLGENNQHLILIYVSGVTPQLNVVVQMLESKGHTIEFFKISELQFNITSHRLVPKSRKIDNPGSFLEKHRDSLPVLLSSDILARFYLYKPGDIIEMTTPRSVYYRIVN